MPGRRQINFLPINKNRVIEFGPGLVVTGNYFGSYRGTRTEVTTIDAAGGSTCPLPMTRTALIALRNASGLTKDCDYVVTDHVQGRLVAGTQIHLQAVSANKLSENVSVNTTYDNEAWAGIYDLDRGIVLELHDNRNNVARGANGTEVANFDWGNANITNTTVDSATWTHTIGSPRIVSDLTVASLATLTTTGWAGGSITGGTVIRGFGTNVNMTNANASLLIGEIKDASILNLSGFTAGSTLNRYNLASSNFNFSNSTSAVSLSIVTSVGSTFNHSGVTTGTVTGTNLTMNNTSFINHSNRAGNLSLNRVDLINQANITHTAGTMTISGTTIDSSTVQQGTTAGATMSLNQVFAGRGSNINNQAAGALSLTGTIVDPVSTVQRLAGATGSMTVNYSRVRGSSQITNSATNTGVTNVTYSEVKGSSQITNNSAVAMGITRAYLSGNSTINTVAGSAGTISITDSFLRGNSNISKQAGSTAGTLSMTGGTTLDASSFINLNGTGNLIVTQSKMSGNSGISIPSGNRSYNFFRLTQSGVARANLSGTGAATDQHNELEMYSRGNYTNSCSGAVNNVNYTSINGLSGSLTLSGTTGGFNSSRLKLFDGQVTKSNNPNPQSIHISTVSDGSTINLANNPVNDIIQYAEITNSSVLNVNRTGAGTISVVKVYNSGTVNVLGTTGAINKLDVEQGTVTINAGSISNLSKKMNSVLTINAGAQNNVSHWSSTNKTATAANTNRVDYLGVVSSVPLI